MPNVIRILHLEDSALDADLVRERLGLAGIECDVVRVDCREDFTAALATGRFDLILCDYNVPGYDGMSALELARARQPSIPVILLSGSLGEEQAVQCLQMGATDYLLKQRLDRLPAAVRRAISEAQERHLRQQAETQVRESEGRFRQIAENSSEGFWFAAVDPERMQYVSPAVERIWGRSAASLQANFRTWTAAIEPSDQPRVFAAWDACVEGRSPRFEAEYRVVRPDGSIRWVVMSGTPIRDDEGRIARIGGVIRDVTESRQAEAMLLRTQRLESIGTLAGGLAHDLNNALAPIHMATELLQAEMSDVTEDQLELIEMIRAGAKRGAEMVRQLLTFAKGVEGERQPLDPRELMVEMEKLVRGAFPKSIRLETRFADHLPDVLGDTTQLHQVLLNLCVNARDAMPDGGTLTLVAETCDLDETVAASPLSGRVVAWRVTDTGTGIAPEVLERIFEPYYTTKGPHEGTGLGLSTVLGIVKSHGGSVVVDSAPGRGSTFSVFLPRATAAAIAQAASVVDPEPFHASGETVLVVDDDPAVRQILCVMLTAMNLDVLTANDGVNALLVMSEHAARLRAIVTDCHMPHMAGTDLVRIVRSWVPSASVVVTSGRLDEREEANLRSQGVTAILPKPFTRAQLSAAMRGALS